MFQNVNFALKNKFCFRNKGNLKYKILRNFRNTNYKKVGKISKIILRK